MSTLRGLGVLSIFPYEVRRRIFNFSLPSAVYAVHPHDPLRCEPRRCVIDNETVLDKIPDVLQVLFVSKSVNKEIIDAIYACVVVNFNVRSVYPGSPVPPPIHIDRMKHINLTVDLEKWTRPHKIEHERNEWLAYLMIRALERFAEAPLPRKTFRFDVIDTARKPGHIFHERREIFSELKKMTSLGVLVVGVYQANYQLPFNDRWARSRPLDLTLIKHEITSQLEDCFGLSVMQTYKDPKDTNETTKNNAIGATWTFYPRVHANWQVSLRTVERI